MTTRTRALEITADRVRAYSRRGNYHSDASAAEELGLGGLLVQGVQVAGPAYGELLDEWGDDFLRHGELDLRFLSPVYAETTVEATVTVDGDAAELRVAAPGATRDAVVGTARRAHVTP
ncbi:MAG TPA: MaoC/PaaZ C-terminal domain-containing protein [Acidimicrobiia bacterium]|nr:MaoC/PaaZ C-terminal domain-containing protein [Acidimicrobiia bacterium]